MKRWIFVLLLACENPDKAVDPVWGKQACSGCGMIVSNHDSASEIVTTDGDRLFFDDPGCMVVWMSEHAGKDKRAWVHDSKSATWLDAKSAKWNSGAHTPMDFGWTANATSGESFDTMRADALRKGSER